jgi:hypothetical protein
MTWEEGLSKKVIPSHYTRNKLFKTLYLGESGVIAFNKSRVCDCLG